MIEGADKTNEINKTEKEKVVMELGIIWTSLGQMGNNQNEIQTVMQLQQDVINGIKDPAEALNEARAILDYKQTDH